ncbi:MAG: hypothetical protein QOH98_1249 [Methylobacteriaceae bacterium]|jgi:hypothetical protein|nr:hypothetical protein [Methylobacteriaceae bacterium]
MSERDQLVGVVLSLTELVGQTGPKTVLQQLLSMALLEASECLVRGGFEPSRLTELGLTEDMAYYLDVKCQSGSGGPGRLAQAARRVPYLRLVGS